MPQTMSAAVEFITFVAFYVLATQLMTAVCVFISPGSQPGGERAIHFLAAASARL